MALPRLRRSVTAAALFVATLALTPQPLGAAPLTGVTPAMAAGERILAFSNNTSEITLDLDAGATGDDGDSATVLNVATNAGFGYTITAESTSLVGPGTTVLQPVTAGPNVAGVAGGSFPVNRWGFTVASTAISGNGTFSLASGLTGGTYSGYPMTPQVIASQTGQTNSDALSITTRARIDPTQAAGAYSARVVYTAIASY